MPNAQNELKVIKYKIRKYDSTKEAWSDVYYPETSADQVKYGSSGESTVAVEIAQLKSDVTGISSDLSGVMLVNDYVSSSKIKLEKLPDLSGTYATKTFVQNIANGLCKTYVATIGEGKNGALEILTTSSTNSVTIDTASIVGISQNVEAYWDTYIELSTNPDLDEMKVGDVILITNLNVADLWVSNITTTSNVITSITFSRLETQKYDLSTYVTTSRTISTSGAGITGGGSLAANRTISLSSNLQKIHNALSTIEDADSEGCLYIEQGVSGMEIKPIRLFDYTSNANNFGISLDESETIPIAYVQVPSASTSVKGIAKFTAGNRVSISAIAGDITIGANDQYHIGDSAPTDTTILWLDTSTAS